MDLIFVAIVVFAIVGLSWGVVAVADLMSRDEDGFPKN